MPQYSFNCAQCEIKKVITIPAEIVNNDPDWNKVKCEDCNTLMDIYFDRDAIPNFAFTKGESPPSVALKAKHAAQKSIEVMNEGFTSQMELEQGMGMAAELEKSKGKTQGALSTGVKAVTTKEQKEAIKKRDTVKKQEQIKLRRKSGF